MEEPTTDTLKRARVQSRPFRIGSILTALAALLGGPVFGALAAPAPGESAPPAQRFVFEKAEMGVPFRLTFYAPGQEAAQAAADAAFSRVEALNGILSDYDPDSELSRLGQQSGGGHATQVSGELWTILDRSQAVAEQTGGAFDVTIGPLVNLWRRMRRQGALPTPDLLSEMRGRVGYRFMRLDRQERTVELLKPDMRLDVGGIAKGYAADEALAVLRAKGCPRALVAASGDLRAGDPPPGEAGWRIGVESLALPPQTAPPPEVLVLAHQGISTSGDQYQYVEIDGVRYSHILDPRTGLGLTTHSLVTVVAADGLTADGLDTAIDIMGPEAGLELIKKWPGVSMRVQREVGGRRVVDESPGWKDLPSAR